MMIAVSAQELTKGEAALVYYSPKTMLSIDFTYSVQTQETGPYARYAKSLLGIDAITETKSSCSIESVRINSRTETDYSRAHKVDFGIGIPLLLSINDKGLLTGYNVSEQPTTCNDRKNSKTQPQENACSSPHTVAPFTEEVLEAKTQESQAQAIVKQILHLREMRTYLLSGELENGPKDGSGIKQVLAELEKQEAQLTELFVGKTSQRTETKSMSILPSTTPSETIQEELFFFSRENGFTEGDNIDADTIRVRLALHPMLLAEPPVLSPEEQKKAKKQVVPATLPIHYNIPGYADVQVLYKDRVLRSRTLPIAQLGVEVPLSRDLFSGKELPQIKFSEKTGNIESITK